MISGGEGRIMKRVSLLGMGLMGSRMARRLIEAGYAVTVWNRNRNKCQPLGNAGAEIAPTAADAARQADVILSMLSDGKAVDEVVATVEAQGTLRQGAVWIDMSSIPPALAREHALRLRKRGVDHLDAPVSGGTVGAAEGTLAIFCGGEVKVYEAVEALFRVLGRATHVGPHGSGQLTKLCNQVIVATTIGAVSEALLLAQAGGAKPEALVEALQGGFADSRILREHGKRMLQRDWRPGGTVAHQIKDLDTVQQQASECEVQLPVTTCIGELFRALQEQGGGALDHAALLLEIERRNAPHRVGEAPDQKP